jgi:hypothetical protein
VAVRVEGGTYSVLGSVRCVPVWSLLPLLLVFLALAWPGITCA